MNSDWNRRDFMQLISIGGVAMATGAVVGCAPRAAQSPVATAGPLPPPPATAPETFFFLQLSDTHWGFKGAPNPHADVTLEHAIATIPAVDRVRDFDVFTGDLTHMTEDAGERRDRMARFREIVAALKVKEIHFLPGEHDAGIDGGDAFRRAFGDMHWSFDHKGVHFVALDNVSATGGGALGSEQLQWLTADLARVPANVPVIVFAHRPLFDLYPEWDWMTKDGAQAIDILAKRDRVTVFYGHIHQELSRTTGKIAHHSARSLVFPLPPPGSVPKKAPLVWSPDSPDHGLGWREIALDHASTRVTEVAFR